MRKTTLLALGAITLCACKTPPPPPPPDETPTVEVRNLPATRFAAFTHSEGGLRQALMDGMRYASKEGWPLAGPPVVVYVNPSEVWVGYPLNGPVDMEEPWRIESIPGMTVAVHAMMGFEENEDQGRDAAVAQTVAAGHPQAGPVIQVFLNDPMSTSEDEYETELLVPVRIH